MKRIRVPELTLVERLRLDLMCDAASGLLNVSSFAMNSIDGYDRLAVEKKCAIVLATMESLSDAGQIDIDAILEVAIKHRDRIKRIIDQKAKYVK